MTTSTLHGPSVAGPQAIAADADGFDLDVRIVESGAVSSVLMANTDDGLRSALCRLRDSSMLVGLSLDDGGWSAYTLILPPVRGRRATWTDVEA